MRLRELTEARSSTAVMAFGRMNPPTIGHKKLADKIKSLPGDPFLFLSQTQKPKTDPLDFATKIKFARQFFPGISIGSADVKIIIQALKKVDDMGYSDLVYVAGSDRVNSFEELLNKYNGAGDYNFESIEVVSAGERDPDAEGAEGMSASKMRELAREDAFEEFAQGVPDPRLAQELYNAVRKGMGIKTGELDMSENKHFEKYLRALNAITEGKLREFEDDDDFGDDDFDDENAVKGPRQEHVQSQLMKIADSDPDDENIKNPVNTVMTSDGDEVTVDHKDAVKILQVMTADIKPQLKKQIQDLMQTTNGLQKLIDHVRAM